MDATWMITTFVLIDTTMTDLDHQTDVRDGNRNPNGSRTAHADFFCPAHQSFKPLPAKIWGRNFSMRARRVLLCLGAAK